MKAAAVGLEKNVAALLAHWRIDMNLQDQVMEMRAPIIIPLLQCALLLLFLVWKHSSHTSMPWRVR